MSGIYLHNFPAFRRSAALLRRNGHEVVSPVEMDEGEGFDAASHPNVEPGSEQWAAFLARDVAIVADATIEGVVVLDGWEASRGAALEVHVARELGKPVYRHEREADSAGMWGEWSLVEVKAPTSYRPPSNETVLEEAQRLVHGDRGEDYGHPGDDFARTAGCWRALFGWDVAPEQVALAMVCVKLSRLVETPDKRDSVVDVAGYAEAYRMVIDRAGIAPA